MFNYCRILEKETFQIRCLVITHTNNVNFGYNYGCYKQFSDLKLKYQELEMLFPSNVSARIKNIMCTKYKRRHQYLTNFCLSSCISCSQMVQSNKAASSEQFGPAERAIPGSTSPQRDEDHSAARRNDGVSFFTKCNWNGRSEGLIYFIALFSWLIP